VVWATLDVGPVSLQVHFSITVHSVSGDTFEGVT